MPVLMSLVLGLGLGYASRGNLRNLGISDLRFKYLVLGAFLVQGLARGRIGTHGSATWGLVVWGLASLVLVVALLFQRNSPTLWIVAVGIAANLLVVLLNGYMPVFVGSEPDIARVARGLAGSNGFYALGDAHTLASVLSDSLRMPLIGQTYMLSAGDVLMVAGVSGFIVDGMREPRAQHLTDRQL